MPIDIHALYTMIAAIRKRMIEIDKRYDVLDETTEFIPLQEGRKEDVRAFNRMMAEMQRLAEEAGELRDEYLKLTT